MPAGVPGVGMAPAAFPTGGLLGIGGAGLVGRLGDGEGKGPVSSISLGGESWSCGA